MRNTLKFQLVFILVFVCTSLASAFEGKVVGIADGDTISILKITNNVLVKIRLYGIDCPESGQAYGKQAKRFTSSVVFGQNAEVIPVDTDRYGRTVAFVEVNGVSLNQSLIQNGYAWVYPQYCKESLCEEWYTYQRKAQLEHVGLWKETNPVAPWEWRHSPQKVQQEYSNRLGRERQRATYKASITSSGSYHGNVKSDVFHGSGCKWYNCKNCTRIFKTRNEAIRAGYRPCKKCNP